MSGDAAPGTGRDPSTGEDGAGRDRRAPRARIDTGYFTGDLAHAAVAEGCDFAIPAKRNTAMWRAYSNISDDAWVDAQAMPGAQGAPVDYAPGGWPDNTYTIVRRARVDPEAISTDPRLRRRRAIDPDQLSLALQGVATHAYAVSFIVTNTPTHEDSEKGETVRDGEACLRRRTDIEDRIREVRLGAALCVICRWGTTAPTRYGRGPCCSPQPLGPPLSLNPWSDRAVGA